MGSYLITGATRGIGRQVVAALQGEELYLLGRDVDSLRTVCEQTPGSRPIVADLSQPENLAGVLSAARLPSRLDGVIHVAGNSVDARICDSTFQSWRQQLDINVVAVAEITRLLLAALRSARGTVVLVNSGAGKAVRAPGRALYAASKHALVAFADGLRIEEPSLRVVSVFPGRVATNMQRSLRAFEGQPYVAADYLDPATVAGVIVAALRIPSDGAMNEVTIVPRTRT